MVIPWGRQNPSGAQNLSGGQRFLPAHWGLGLQKLGQVRFRNRAWLYRTNAPSPVSAVRAHRVRPRAGPYGKAGEIPPIS